MPPLKGNKKACKNRKRSATGGFIRTRPLEDWEKTSIDDERSTNDKEILIETPRSDPNLNISVTEACGDTETKSRSRPSTYSITSRTTLQRNRKKAKAVEERQKLASSGLIAPPVKEVVYSRSEMELVKIREMMPKIEEFVKPVVNSKQEGFTVDAYKFVRYLSIKYYFLQRLEGKKLGEASSAAAELYWEKNNKKYRADTIVKWAKQFLSEGDLVTHARSAYSKKK